MMELLNFAVSTMLYCYELAKIDGGSKIPVAMCLQINEGRRINYLVYIIGCVQDEEWCRHVIQEILWKHALHKYKTSAITISASNKKQQQKQTEKLNRRPQ